MTYIVKPRNAYVSKSITFRLTIYEIMCVSTNVHQFSIQNYNTINSQLETVKNKTK